MSATPHGIRFSAHRPVVMGRNGMVCAGHPLAAQAGVSVLHQGGNAVDAAIATAAALGVVEPLMSGIGGDGFIMAYLARRGPPAGQQRHRRRALRRYAETLPGRHPDEGHPERVGGRGC